MKDCLSFALFMLAGCFADGALLITFILILAGALLQYDKMEAEFNKFHNSK